MSDADAALKRQVDTLIGRGPIGYSPPTPLTTGRGATSPVKARRSSRRSGVSSPYSSPMGRRSSGPRARRLTPGDEPPGAAGSSGPPTGQQRHEARIHFDQGRYAESAAGMARVLKDKLGAAPETVADFRAAVQHIS